MSRPLRNLASQLLAEAHELLEDASQAYAGLPGEPAFWMLTDLRSSASFRLAVGEKAAFVRASGFMNLCKRLGEMFKSISIFKVLGDAVLVRATDPRDLIEFLVLLNLAGAYASVDDSRDKKWPSLASRSAITFGRAIEIDGDYLGAALDRLARLSAYRPEKEDWLAVIDNGAKPYFLELIEEYPFVTAGSSLMMPPTLLKPGEESFRLSVIHLDQANASASRDFFSGPRQDLDT